MKAKSWFTYDYKAVPQCIISGVSLTVPDQVLSIHEIISRFTRGQALPFRVAVNADEDVSSLDKLDKFERIDLKRATDKQIYAYRADLVKQLGDKQRSKAEAAIESRIEAEVAKRSKPAPEA